MKVNYTIKIFDVEIDVVNLPITDFSFEIAEFLGSLADRGFKLTIKQSRADLPGSEGLKIEFNPETKRKVK